MPVALLAEGVDRNVTRLVIWPQTWVALLAEGVDRNFREVILLSEKLTSPSSRRAWIEITRKAAVSSHPATVALLAEGVDRNSSKSVSILATLSSPSSRRAWIEIVLRCFACCGYISRPPRGGRG